MMDAPATPEPGGVAEPPGALRGFVAALLEALHTRLELAGVEVEIHLRALLRSLIWTLGAVACAILALGFGMFALVAALWDSHRMLALLMGMVLFVLLAVLFGYLGARALRTHPDVLEGSLEQLAEDQRRARGAP